MSELTSDSSLASPQSGSGAADEDSLKASSVDGEQTKEQRQSFDGGQPAEEAVDVPKCEEESAGSNGAARRRTSEARKLFLRRSSTTSPNMDVIESNEESYDTVSVVRRHDTAVREDYPEVDMMLEDLERRVATLQTLLPEHRETAAVSLSEEQTEAIRCLPSNIKGLVSFLDHRHQKQKRDQPKIARELNERPKVGRDKSWRNSISKMEGASLDGSDTERGQTFPRELPPELVNTLMSMTADKGETESLTASEKQARDSRISSCAYLCQEFGGVDVPTSIGVPAKEQGKRSFRVFAKALSNSRIFVNSVKRMTNTDRSGLEYLPTEFSRLELKERKRLAQLLSWDSLKEWGFNAFEVDELSASLMYRDQSKRDLSESQVLANDISISDLEYHPGSLEREQEREQRVSSHRSISSLNMEDSLDNFDRPQDNLESVLVGCPIVLIGWAIFASPYAQLAMAKNVEDEELTEVAWTAIAEMAKKSKGCMARGLASLDECQGESNGESGKEDGDECQQGTPKKLNLEWDGGYFFVDEFKISPREIVTFLRRVESEYCTRDKNPYHSNIHGADVTQSTHALLQLGGQDLALVYPPLEIYSILLSALLHDIRHPGQNNSYQITKRTDLARVYNDISVLESMHASRACYMLDSRVSGDQSRSILGAMTEKQQSACRHSVIKSILETDMSRHFGEMTKMTGHITRLEEDIDDTMRAVEDYAARPSLLSQLSRDRHAKLRQKFLPWMLHLADISNPTKKHDVSLQWVNCCYDEFFLQGDKEREEKMPISTLCDRNTTNVPESQIGFMKFVVRPAFRLLARVVPLVEDVVLKEYMLNLEHWENEAARASKATS